MPGYFRVVPSALVVLSKKSQPLSLTGFVLQFLSSGGAAQTAGDSRIDSGSQQFRSRRGASHADDVDDDEDRDERQNEPRNHGGYSFTPSDRNILNGCLSGYDFESLPPGIQRKLARGGTLPPGQAKKLHALPDSCSARLPRLPRDLERIIFGDRVIVLQNGSRILDMLTFER